MKNEIKDFRDGVFSLHTRRFGTIAELIIVERYGLSKSTTQHHDATNPDGSRAEIKFSRVLKANEKVITKKNILTQAVNSSALNRAVESYEIKGVKFDCNIQQVKRNEFDLLYYGLFFADKIAVFTLKSEDVLDIPGYSDFQHKGNEGEGQFHLTNDSLKWHIDNNIVEWITYEEIYEMFREKETKIC